MNRRLRTYAYAVLLALLPAAGWTADRWEASNRATTTRTTRRTSWSTDPSSRPRPGTGPAGRDRSGLDVAAEQGAALVRGARHQRFLDDPAGCSGNCATFNRVDPVGSDPDLGGQGRRRSRTSIPRRWACAGSPPSARTSTWWPRARSTTAPSTPTTSTSTTPRTSCRASTTRARRSRSWSIQNTKDAPVTGEIYFYNGAGTLLSTQPLSIPAQGVQRPELGDDPRARRPVGLRHDRPARRVRSAHRQGRVAGTDARASRSIRPSPRCRADARFPDCKQASRSAAGDRAEGALRLIERACDGGTSLATATWQFQEELWRGRVDDRCTDQGKGRCRRARKRTAERS